MHDLAPLKGIEGISRHHTSKDVAFALQHVTPDHDPYPAGKRVFHCQITIGRKMNIGGNGLSESYRYKHSLHAKRKEL
jgi:hypothetical protein